MFYVFVYIYFVLSKFYVTLNSSFMMINEKSAGKGERERYMVHHHQGGSCRYTSRVPPSLQ